MKNSLSQKLLATILSVALLLNSSAVVFATDEGISGADGTPIVTASETATTTEETTSTDETTTNETTLLGEDATTESNEQGDLSDPEGSDSVLPGDDANESDCTCNPAIGTSGVEGHGKDCPLYVAPAQPDCTCPPVDSGEVVHGKGCPLYEVPEAPVCVCASLCAEGAANANCPTCADDFSQCGFVAPVSTPSEAVLALIAALPTMEELEAVDTQAPEFAEYLAQLRLDTAAARAAYDALTDEEKAAFDETALLKLTALEEALAAMPMLMAAAPVTTWAELKTAIEAAPTNGVETAITINGTIESGTVSVIDIKENQNIAIDGGEISGTEAQLFKIPAAATLTLKNFRVDGKKVPVYMTSIIQNYGKLSIGEGCVFENIALYYGQAIIWSGGSGTCEVTGGIFRNNVSEKNASDGYLCVAIYNAGTVNITGGTFINNKNNGSGYGAALYNISTAKCYITGGTFDSGNVAMVNKAGIFHSSREGATGEMHLSGDPAINCPIFLDAGNADKFIFLDGALTGNVTLKPAKYEENYVLVKAADGYTLTNDDYLNIKLLQPASGTWYTKLSADNLSIVATEAVGERLATVYLAPVSGNDTYDGKTAATAIKTFDKAKQLLANGGKIILVPPVTISTDELWELPDGVFGGATVTDEGKVIITVGSGGNLNLGDVTIDGIDRIEVESGGSVTLGNATVIKPEAGGTTDIVVGGGGTLNIGTDTNLANIDKIYTTDGGTVNDNGNTAAGGKTDSTTTPPSVPDPPPAVVCTCALSALTFANGTIEILHDAANATKELTASGSALTGNCAVSGHSSATVTYSFAEKTDTSNIASITGNTLTVTGAGSVTITATATANGKTATTDAVFTVTKASAPVAAKITILVNGTTTVGGESLQAAVAASGVTTTNITKLEITAGAITEADRTWFKTRVDGDHPFKKLTNFKMADSVIWYGDPIIKFNMFPKSIAEIDIPQAKKIEQLAFKDCTALNTINFPNVTEIGEEAFQGCSRLTAANFPKAEVIGVSAFNRCSMLADVSFPKLKGPSGGGIIPSDAFSYCTSLTKIEADDFPTVTLIRDFAFDECTDLVSVSFPRARSIGESAFRQTWTSYLSSVEFPNVTEIGKYAFKGRQALESVSFPKVERINEAAFDQCYGLEEVSLTQAASKIIIGERAFEDSYLEKLTLYGGIAPQIVPRSSFGGTGENLVLVDKGGAPMTGDELTTAIALYKAAPDGNTTDNRWYGWLLPVAPADPVASWVATGGGTGQGTLTEALAEVKASGGTVTLLTNVDDRMNAIDVTISEFSQPVTLVLNGKTLHANVIFDKVTGLFTVDGTVEGSKIQGATGAALESDGSNFKLKGGTYIGAFDESGNTSEEAPAIAMEVPANKPEEVGKLYTLLAEGYTFANKDGFNVISDGGDNGIAVTGNRVEVIAASEARWTSADGGATATSTLKAALELAKKNGGTVTLLTDVEVRDEDTGYISTLMIDSTFKKAVTLVLNGHTLTGNVGLNGSSTELFTIDGSKDGSTVKSPYSFGIMAFDGAKLKLQGGTYTSDSVDYPYAIILVSATSVDALKELLAEGYAFKDEGEFKVVTEDGQTSAFTGKTVKVVPAAPPKITITVNGNTTEYGGADLKAAVTASGVDIDGIKTLEITAGEVTDADWKALKTTLPALTTLEIDKAVETVANIPAGQLSSPIFPQSLISVTIPQAITVGEFAFSNLRTRLTTVNLSGATKIDYRAFYECDNLATVTLNSVTEIAGEAFYGCEKLKTITLPKADKIGFSAFYDCTALSSVALPVVTSIETAAFQNCTVLATMKLPASPPSAKSNSFNYCAADRSIAFVNATGNQLAGAELTNAQAAYDDITTDRNKKDDGLWYGWKVRGSSVTVPVTGVSVNKTTLSLEAGKNETLTATIIPANATNKAVTWQSSAADVATVDENGKVTAVAVGSVTITVTTTDGGKTATCAVTVTAVVTKPAPGGKLEAPLDQDKVDDVFGEGNATLDNTQSPPKITVDNSITPEKPIEIETDVTIDLGGNTITGKPGQPGLVVGDGDKVTIGGGGTISGGDNSGGAGGNGITGGAGSDITIGGGVTVEGGDGGAGGDGINSGGNVTVDGSVSGGSGSSSNGGAGVDTSGGSGNITIKPDGSASGGNSTGGNGNGGDGTISGGNTTVNGDVTGGSGSGSGSGGNGAESSGSGSVEVGNGGSATGGAGGNTGSGTGGNGGNGTSTGSGSTDINAGGSAGGGNGGTGSTGGNGGNGSVSTGGGNITNGGSTTGGNGGSGATGGNGGNGTTTDGSTTVNPGGSSTGGTGGSGSTTGGNGGNGTSSGSTTVNGGATGGSGGSGTSGSNGNGGNGGNGANQGSGTVGGNGTATGGNGGSGAGTGTGGNGGSGVGGGATAGDQLTTKDGINAKVEVVGDSGTKVKLPDPAKTVDAVLTDAEKSDPDITNVKVTLKVDDKTAAKPDQAAVEAQKPAGSSIGAFFDITLLKTITGGTNAVTDKLVTNTSGLIKITIEIPSGMRDGEENSYVVIRVHNGTAERLNTTQSGNELTFETDKFSTYAIAYTKNATPPSPPSDNTGGGGSSSDNGEYDFWMSVKEKIQKADSGDVIKVNAKGYDKMPWSVMDTLRKNDGVSLVITWNGKTITIPAGKAQKNEPGRIYWPLSKLAELYEGLTQDSVLVPQNPETGGPGKYIPVTGGGELITLEAPSPVMENVIPGGADGTQTTASTQPKAITPPDAGFEQDAFAGTPDNPQQATSNNTFAVIALMLAAVAVGSGVWFWKKRQGAQ